MASETPDDGFHEIQLNGKQLVFLFMAATVVSVVIFLCGVLVGRGVRAERAAAVADTTTAAVEPAPQQEHLGYRMIALEVDDMQKTADELKAKGVDIVWGPMVRDTYARAEICDPNGYRIELRQWF